MTKESGLDANLISGGKKLESGGDEMWGWAIGAVKKRGEVIGARLPPGHGGVPNAADIEQLFFSNCECQTHPTKRGGKSNTQLDWIGNQRMR